jgi:hypothetical protein
MSSKLTIFDEILQHWALIARFGGRKMESSSWFGARIPKRARESRLLALLLPNLRLASPIRATELSSPFARENGGEETGGLGWTAGLSRGADLPPLRLSIRPDSCLPESCREPGRRSAMRFELWAPELTGAQAEIRRER